MALARPNLQTAEPDPRGDADLLRAYGRGDSHAFARLYDRHDRACFRFIRRMLGAAHSVAAEDLHQEVWIAISRNAAAFDPDKASFATWLFTIARRKVLDHFRRETAAPLRSDLEDGAMTAPAPGPTPLAQIESRELAERLVKAVEGLPLEQRAAFIMVAEGGLSLAEVAEATGVPAETAKSRLRYARQRLRHVLAGERSDHV